MDFLIIEALEVRSQTCVNHSVYLSFVIAFSVSKLDISACAVMHFKLSSS